MTFNFWADHPRHPPWVGRRDGAAAIVARHRPDLLGGQELLRHQVTDLAARLPREYAWLGVGRDDGMAGGEFNPIFYRRDRFEPRATGTFWLSPEPERPGVRGWGAACPRIVTWARFADLDAGGDHAGWWHFNTHLDHASFRARREGARLLAQRVGAMALPPDARVLLTGDLNGGERSAAVATLRANGLRDAFHATAAPPEGPRRTWRGFHGSGLGAARLDFVFVGGENVRVLRYTVVDDRGADGRIVSDHRPLWVEVGVRAGG